MAYNAFAMQVLMRIGWMTNDQRKREALYNAVLSNSTRFLERVIKEGVDLDDRNCHRGMTAIHLAVDLNYADIVNVLVDKGADINLPATTFPYMTPLIRAVLREDNVDMARQLLNAGADPLKLDIDGNSPLHYAAICSIKSVELLLSVGVDVNIASGHMNITPLMYAIKFEKMGNVNQLLNRGAKPLLADSNGETALHYASRYSAESLELLLSKGFNVNVIERSHNFRKCRSPLMTASDSGNLSAMLLLLNKGADVNLKSCGLQTALHFAKTGRVVEILWEWGADINGWGIISNIPLHFEITQMKVEVLEAIMSLGPLSPDYILFIHRSFDSLNCIIIEIIIKLKPVYDYDTTYISRFDPNYAYNFEEFISQCSLEVKQMKEATFGRFSVFQVLVKGLTDCTFMANTEMCEFIENKQLKHDFPLYHTNLQRHLRIAKRRHSLISRLVYKYTLLVESNIQIVLLPEEVCTLILSHLTTADLIRLNRTLDPNFELEPEAVDTFGY